MSNSEQDTTTGDPRSAGVLVSVPAMPASIELFRAVISSVAAELDFSLEEISDAGLAVEEAYAFLLASFPGRERIDLRLELDGGTLGVAILVEGPADAGGVNERRLTLLREVLGMLAERVDLAPLDGSPAVRFRKRSSRHP
jgi:hypothetical protein